MADRTNEQWIADLTDADSLDSALKDLRTVLLRGLRASMVNRSSNVEANLEDFVQEALLKILDGLDTFRGESKFTTWGQKIAVRVALTELRRLRWRDTSLDEMIEGPDASTESMSDYIPLALADTSAGPEDRAVQGAVLETMQRVIQERLTDRQRQALVAVRIHGIPLEEVAHRMDTNRNSLYKLLHDARLRLKKELLAEGLSAQDILDAFDK